MKHIYQLLLVLVALLPQALWAASGTETKDDVTYTYTDDNKAKVTSVATNATSVKILAKITVDETEYDVTEVAATAFSGCSSLIRIEYQGTVLPTTGSNVYKDTPTNLCICYQGLAYYHVGNAWNSGDHFEVGNGSSAKGYQALDGGTTPTSLSILSAIDGISVTKIANSAFTGMYNFTSISIPASITEISSSAFANSRVQTFSVDASNANYASDGGVLYNKAKTTLIAYPAGNSDASFTVPNAVKTIGDYAISYAQKLETVTIPSGVTTIGEYNQEIKGETNAVVIPVNC